MIVYDLEGQPHEMEHVDAQECVREMGWSLTPISNHDICRNPILDDLTFVESKEETLTYKRTAPKSKK